MKSMSLIILLTIASFFSSCSKGDSGNNANNNAPANLTLTAVVATDQSGDVTFKATATNAVTYEFDFGNGMYQNSTDGTVTYRYPATGNYKAKVVAKSSAGLSATKSVDVVVIKDGNLIFSDEFNIDGAPDPTKWGYDLGNNNGWGNQESQYYTNRRENSYISGGTLKIVAIRENYMGFPFTSARLLTKDKFAFTYGRVEVSAKVPTGVGTWPAIWMLGSNINTVPWPGCGEIDIMEHLGRDLNKIYGTFHYPGRSGGNANGNTKIISNATTQFHKYSVDWRAESIKIYVDDELVHSLANSNAVPFNHDFFIILNLAMGGTFAGPVDANVNGGTLEIDYVRVFK